LKRRRNHLPFLPRTCSRNNSSNKTFQQTGSVPLEREQALAPTF
jgi:hypothetical protein